jgi:hypothetical protein
MILKLGIGEVVSRLIRSGVGPDGILEMANRRRIEAEFGEQHAFSEQGAKIPTTLPIEAIDDLEGVMGPILFEISLGKKVETAGVLGMLSYLRLNFMKVGILSLFRGEIPPPVQVGEEILERIRSGLGVLGQGDKNFHVPL